MTDFISPVILNRIPQYIQDQYPDYVQFLTDYIQFLERDEGFLGILESWRHNMEPSNNVDPYIDKILADCGMYLQRPITVPKSTLLFFLRDFMLSRGSAQSFNMLFQLLFGVNCSVDYPRDRMLWLSSASYGETDYIYTKTDVWYGTTAYQFIVDNIASYGGTATGSNSGVVASIQDIQVIGYNGGYYLQIQILKPLQEFLSNDLITINVNGTTINEPILPIAVLEVVSAGSGYAIDDKVIVDGTLITGRMNVDYVTKGGITGLSVVDGGCGYSVGANITANTGTFGSGFSGYVTAVDDLGSITAVQIDTEGYNYNTLPSLRVNQTTTAACVADIQPNSTQIGQISSVRTIVPYLGFTNTSDLTVRVISSTGSGATFSVTMGTRFTTNAWVDQKGFVGYNTVVQDSYKYQTFSYRLLSPINPSLYQDVVNDLLHPAGFVKTFCVTIEGSGATTLTPTAGFALVQPIVIIDYSTTVTYALSDFSILSQVAPNNLVVNIDQIGTQAALVTADRVEIVWQSSGMYSSGTSQDDENGTDIDNTEGL